MDLDQLIEQATALGIEPEVHEPEGFIFLRNVPDGAQHDPTFQPLVEDCLANNVAAMDSLRTELR